ncbi:MAG: S8 family serine peptidase [Thermoanaerobaculia bacterium]
MKRLLEVTLALVLLALPLQADEVFNRIMQSGDVNGPASVHDHGIHGEREIIAILDTGLDWDGCLFAEADHAPPPVNTITADGKLETANVDLSRRKVVAYDFLYSCDENPFSPGCDDPQSHLAWDNQGHGTFAASVIAGDSGTPIAHDYGDGFAPGAKLVIQDAGFIGGDSCSQRPGLQCPLRDLRPVLQQAWDQGARIQSNSWGDRQGKDPTRIPLTGNYSSGARDIDDFVWRHPDMVVVFNTGNAGALGASSLSSPGLAKNTIDVGGVERTSSGILRIVDYSGTGPTRDGRIKPDLVAPAMILGAQGDNDISTNDCNFSFQGGTSWSSPTVAGLAALVRQYYRDGFYPDGERAPASAIDPSAALVKATLIASARRVPYLQSGSRTLPIDSVPSFEEGFGMPVLDDALYFRGDTSRLKVVDVGDAGGLMENQSRAVRLDVRPGVPLKAVLVWTDPPGSPVSTYDPTPELVHDLDLVVTAPDGTLHYGNETLHPGTRDRLNNAEVVEIADPLSGAYVVRIDASRVSPAARQGFALVVTGDLIETGLHRRTIRPPAAGTSGTGSAAVPFVPRSAAESGETLLKPAIDPHIIPAHAGTRVPSRIDR